MNRSSMSKQMMREGGKVKPKKKKLTAAQITAIRNKPVSQRTMAEVRMIIPNAVNKMGHTQAEFDKYSSGAKQVNEARAANKAAAAKPVQGAGNMPLDDKQAAQQVDFLKSKNKEKEVKGAKKMARGGMATANKYDKNKKERMHEADLQSGRLRMDKSPNPNQKPTEDQIDYDISDPAGFNKGGMAKKMKSGGMTSKMSKQKGGNTVIVDPAKKSPKSRMKTSGSSSKMAMMKKGGKVRGYGMARGGKACKMR